MRVFSEGELENEVCASVQARGGHPNIVNVVGWDPDTSELVTEDMGRCGLRLGLMVVSVLQRLPRRSSGIRYRDQHVAQQVIYGGSVSSIRTIRALVEETRDNYR